MSLFNILAVAVALAMDAFAVAIAAGITLKTITFRQQFRLSWHFGFFQAMMPVIGWFAGLSVRHVIEQWDHWIAFILLVFVSGKMLKDAVSPEDHDPSQKGGDPSKGFSLVLLSVATSIDALAVGLSLAVLKVSIWLPAAVIGIVAALFTLTGLYLGSRAGRLAKLSTVSEIFGGLVLLGIGVNILIEHGVFDR